jgi:hypothetical protein
MLALIACAQPPQAEIDAAKAQVAKAAGDPDVVAYAPETLKRAQDALSKMDTELAAKHYDKVKAFAAEAQSAAIAAFGDAKTGKERVKTQAESLIASVREALPGAEKAFASAKKLRSIKLDVAATSASIAQAKAALADAEKALSAGDYLGARNKAEAAQTTIADLVKAISEAVQAATRKK